MRYALHQLGCLLCASMFLATVALMPFCWGEKFAAIGLPICLISSFWVFVRWDKVCDEIHEAETREISKINFEVIRETVELWSRGKP